MFDTDHAGAGPLSGCGDIRASGALMAGNQESDMRDDPMTPAEPQTFSDLPIQPTGSGVQDLEIAYEQMRLSEGDGATDNATLPTEADSAVAESEAHPS